MAIFRRGPHDGGVECRLNRHKSRFLANIWCRIDDCWSYCDQQLAVVGAVVYNSCGAHRVAYRVVHQPVSRGFAVFADAWLSGWLVEISADLRETVAH